MSSEAVFMVSVAAVSLRVDARPERKLIRTQEYFIKHFMEEGYTKARLEKRKLINYRDMGRLDDISHQPIRSLKSPIANVVARSEEFDFLRGKNSFIISFPSHFLFREASRIRMKKTSFQLFRLSRHLLSRRPRFVIFSLISFLLSRLFLCLKFGQETDERF